jgi:hypothetical protein
MDQFLLRFLETRNSVSLKLISWSTLTKTSFFVNYLLSFINYILFTAHATTPFFHCEQIKLGADMSFAFLKDENQFLETALQTLPPNFLETIFL